MNATVLASAAQCWHSTSAVSSPVVWGMDKILGKDTTRSADPVRPDIPQHMMSAQIQKLRKRRRKWGIPYLQYLLSRSTATHSEAMLPGKCLSTACWWEIAKNVPFWGFFLHTCDHCLVNCLYLDPQEVFSILFSPTSHPMSC